MKKTISEKSEPCPECGIHAPKRQIDNLGMCERCNLDGFKLKNGEILSPEHDLIDKWKLNTTTTDGIRSEGAT